MSLQLRATQCSCHLPVSGGRGHPGGCSRPREPSCPAPPPWRLTQTFWPRGSQCSCWHRSTPCWTWQGPRSGWSGPCSPWSCTSWWWRTLDPSLLGHPPVFCRPHSRWFQRSGEWRWWWGRVHTRSGGLCSPEVIHNIQGMRWWRWNHRWR